jgi:hypothetical protein
MKPKERKYLDAILADVFLWDTTSPYKAMRTAIPWEDVEMVKEELEKHGYYVEAPDVSRRHWQDCGPYCEIIEVYRSKPD